MQAALRVMARPLTAVGVFASQVLRSAHRQDLPSHNNQDPSGSFGDPGKPELRIVLLGDSSITAPGVVPLDDCWPRRLARHLDSRYYVRLHSVAIGGAKTRDVLDDQLPRALDDEFDMVAGVVGANDALRATPVARFERELDEIILALRARGTMVGVAGIGDLGTVPRLPDLARSLSRVRARSFDGAIRRVVSRHPGVIKGRAWTTGWGLFATHSKFAFAADQFHASGAGHGMFAASAIPVVEALLAAPEPVSGWRGNPGSAN